MRRALVTAFLLALVLPCSATDRVASAGREKIVPAAKPVPTATQGRRRAVRKTPPVEAGARNDAYVVVRGNTLVVAAATGVLANDTDPQSRPLTAILVGTTTHGALTLAPTGAFTYVNDGSSAASDSFTYKATNSTSETNTATVTITITSLPPQALTDAYATGRDVPLTVPAPGVLANDTVNSGAISSYGVNGAEQTTIGSNTATSQGGAVSLAANGGVAYTPPSGFTGSDAFKYVLTSSGGSSTAQVNVSVTPPAPVAFNDSHSTQQGTQLNVTAPGVLGNDTLNGATIVSYGAVSGAEQTTIGNSTPTAAGGTIRLNADGSFRYDPSASFSGGDSFRYAITNAGGTATATVTIVVQSSNAVDFTVTAPGFFYQFSGLSGANPVLTLTRGRTYRFRIDTSALHPFEILDAPPGSVTNNNISNGILTFAVPAGDGSYRYHCSVHDFGNGINTAP
jgi:hypothetical protein